MSSFISQELPSWKILSDMVKASWHNRDINGCNFCTRPIILGYTFSTPAGNGSLNVHYDFLPRCQVHAAALEDKLYIPRLIDGKPILWSKNINDFFSFLLAQGD